MYWWNASKLAQDFQQDRVDEKERFKYYLATIIVWMAITVPEPYLGKTLTLVDVINYAIWISGTVIGVILCYRANKNRDNKDFIGRMICLAGPSALS